MLEAPGGLSIDKAAWEQARLGNVRETLRGLLSAAVTVPPIERGPARMALARASIANGFDPKGSCPGGAAADDLLVAEMKETAIFRALGPGADRPVCGGAEGAVHPGARRRPGGRPVAGRRLGRGRRLDRGGDRAS